MKCALFILVGIASFTVNAATPRLAIVAEGKAAAPFADGLTAALSRDDSCQLVERAELDRLAQEASLPAATDAGRTLALAKLARADAVLFINEDAGDKEHPLLALRLTGTSDGWVRAAFALPWLPKEIEETTRRAVAPLQLALSKLATHAEKKPLLLSFLGFHADVDSPAMRSLETSLNLLAGQRLGAESAIVVLERWRMDDILFERSLAAPLAEPLAAAAVLMDGSFTDRNGAITLRLRLRTKADDQGTIRIVDGKSDHADAMIEGVAKAIKEQQGLAAKAIAWHPDQEAKAFADLGGWLSRHWLAPQAAEAFETAIALGNSEPAVLIGRAKAYAMGAWPDTPKFYMGIDDYNSGRLKTDNLQYHLQSAERAVQVTFDYLRDSGDVPLAVTRIQAWWVLHCALRTLRASYEAGVPAATSRMVGRLRGAIQQFVRFIDESEDSSDGYLHYNCASYAAYWCPTPAETLAYYRKVLSRQAGYHFPGGGTKEWDAALRRMISDQHYNGPFFDAADPNDLSTMRLNGNERLIDWNDPKSAEVKQHWRDFVESLKNSRKPQEQADGLLFEMRSCRNRNVRVQLLEQSTELLWKHREMLTTPDGVVLLSSLPQDYLSIVRAESYSGAGFHRFFDLMQDLFAKEPWVPHEWFGLLANLRYGRLPELLPPQEKEEFLRIFKYFALRVAEDARAAQGAFVGGSYSDILEIQESSLRQAWKINTESADRKPQPEIQRILTVARFWNPRRKLPGNGQISSSQDSFVMLADGGTIWSCSLGGNVVAFDDLSLATEWLPKPKEGNFIRFWSLAPNRDAVWAADSFGVWHHDMHGGEWKMLPLPKARYSVRLLNGEVFVTYGGNDQGNSDSAAGVGVGRLSASGVEWLISSRRRPPVHRLDSVEMKRFSGILSGSQGRIWTAFEDSKNNSYVCAIDEPDSTMFVTKPRVQVFACGEQSLLWQSRLLAERPENIWRFGPDDTTPVLLIQSSAADGSRKGPAKACWPRPVALFDKGPVVPESIAATLHRGQLWVIQHKRSGISQETEVSPYELHGFLPGHPNPIIIPIRFELTTDDLSSLQSSDRRGTVENALSPMIRQQSFVASEHGLAFGGVDCDGIWLLPWADIENWVSRNR